MMCSKYCTPKTWKHRG